jgi:predicted DNA-binding WGR domain protein
MSFKVVDKSVPDRISYKVYEDYSAILNQTNIGKNNNKFYIVQLLHGYDKYHVWTRWGRVGEPGKTNMDSFDSLNLCIAGYEKKFKEKTGNKWINKDSFEPKTGKYVLVEIEEKEGGGDDTAPMGKLTESQIEKGQAILKQLGKAINDNEKIIIYEDLSSIFFTLIPTVTGRKRPAAITTQKMLEEKEELLKFYLRMGFEEVDDSEKTLSPIFGIMDLELCETLIDAIGICANKYDVKNSVSQGEKLLKKKAGNPTRTMNKELYGAIMLYTSNAIYKDLNKVLRDENRRGVKKYFNYLRMFFEAIDSLPKKKVTLWRGISANLYDQYKTPGTQIVWWGVSSCTSEKSVAEGFMHGCGGDCSFLTIDTETATDISDLSFYSSEKESLLAPGTKLEVISCEKKGKTTYIHLKEVGRVIE